MIRNDVKQKLLGKNLEEIFLENRPNVDQPGYRVGEIDGEVVVWNPDNSIIMDYYYDDTPEVIWFSLKLIYSEDGFERYKINRDGKVIGVKKELTLIKDAVWGYPTYKINGKHPKIHTMLSKLFIPNIDLATRTVVDHIDRDKQNFSLSNLRWASVIENSNNLFRPNWTGRHRFEEYSNREKTSLINAYTDVEIFNKGGSYLKGRITNSISISCRCNGSYWKIVDLDVEQYLRSINETTIDETLWRVHYTKKFSVHPLGLIKNGKGNITVGTLSGDKKQSSHLERRYNIKNAGCSTRIHRLVAEVFLNNNKPLEVKQVVDHISTDSLDNRVSNLRICSQKENMNNRLTVTKLSKKVIDDNGIIYSSVTECAKNHNVTATTIVNWIKNPNKEFNYYKQ